jgi:glycosyltransferase involved in cell wall biosynthesis
MKEPLVSVKMITYNHAPYIAHAIDSILKQKTDFPFELVIGEDCSKDGTREIVFDYAKRYPDVIRVITSEQNVGMKKNGLRTVKACKGKYLAYCEGDDYWHNSYKMQMQADYLEKYTECGLVYSSYDVYNVKTRKLITDFITYRNYKVPKNPTLQDIVAGKGGLGLAILTCTVMLRRELYEKIIESDPYLHKNGYFLMGDTQVWAEMATVAQLKFIPESLATHNITVESATRSIDIKKILQFDISGSELMLYLCHKYSLANNIKEIHEANLHDSSLRLAFHTRNVELASKIRREKKTFTWKEWLRYYGTHNSAIYYGYHVMSMLFKLFRKEHDQWQ